MLNGFYKQSTPSSTPADSYYLITSNQATVLSVEEPQGIVHLFPNSIYLLKPDQPLPDPALQLVFVTSRCPYFSLLKGFHYSIIRHVTRPDEDGKLVGFLLLGKGIVGSNRATTTTTASPNLSTRTSLTMFHAAGPAVGAGGGRKVTSAAQGMGVPAPYPVTTVRQQREGGGGRPAPATNLSTAPRPALKPAGGAGSLTTGMIKLHPMNSVDYWKHIQANLTLLRPASPSLLLPTTLPPSDVKVKNYVVDPLWTYPPRGVVPDYLTMEFTPTFKQDLCTSLRSQEITVMAMDYLGQRSKIKSMKSWKLLAFLHPPAGDKDLVLVPGTCALASTVRWIYSQTFDGKPVGFPDAYLLMGPNILQPRKSQQQGQSSGEEGEKKQSARAAASSSSSAAKTTTTHTASSQVRVHSPHGKASAESAVTSYYNQGPLVSDQRGASVQLLSNEREEEEDREESPAGGGIYCDASLLRIYSNSDRVQSIKVNVTSLKVRERNGVGSGTI